MGVKKADKRRIDELRVEVGLKESFKKKLVGSRLIKMGRSRVHRKRGEKAYAMIQTDIEMGELR